MDRIVAVVVTYNRKELLIRCVETLQKQSFPLTSVIVVNNGSTDGTREWLDAQEDLDVIHQENVGGSGGFYRGIQHAYEKGYDWIWCMDDDVYPEPDCLKSLLKFTDEEVGILCPLRKQNGKTFVSEVRNFNLSNPFSSLHHDSLQVNDLTGKDFVLIEGIAFEGPLIKHEVVEKIGLPNKELFILYDDSDYGYRAILAGYKIRLVTHAALNKELFYASEDKVSQIRKSKWKLYYHIRNTVYFNRKYGKNWFVRTLRPLGVLFKYESYVFKNIFFNRKYNLSDACQFLHGYVDGMKGRLGKKG